MKKYEEVAPGGVVSVILLYLLYRRLDWVSAPVWGAGGEKSSPGSSVVQPVAMPTDLPGCTVLRFRKYMTDAMLEPPEKGTPCIVGMLRLGPSQKFPLLPN